MSLRDTTQDLFQRIPTVRRPEGHVSFKRKLVWTVGILAIYFALTNVPIWGLSAQSGGSDFYGQYRSILAGAQGSVLQLGIGPIVTASIVLQLLVAADLFNLNLSDPRDQQYYQSLQKVFVFVMIGVTGIPLILSGSFLPVDSTLAASLGVSLPVLQLVMFLQIAVGGALIVYMDEIVSKWGIGSGVGLFIIAGIAQQLFGGLIESVIPSWYGIATGTIALEGSIGDIFGTLVFGPGSILAIITTVAIFYFVVYAESTRIEIPLSNARVKGARGRFPVKLIYASVMPLILVRAVQANVQFAGRLLNANWSGMPAWLGTYASGQPVGGLFYFLAPIQSPQQWMWWSYAVSGEPWEIAVRVLIDMTWMLLGGALFAMFWVNTTGMGAEKSATQLKNSGLQIPGFRTNTSVIEKVLERYIPYVTVLGGAIIGLLAVLANLLGTIGGVTGTGLLLAVSITYKLYEEMAQEQMMEMNKHFRALFDN